MRPTLIACMWTRQISLTATFTTGVQRLQIELQSPAGTNVVLALQTTPASVQGSFTNYPLSARAFWGKLRLSYFMSVITVTE